MRNISLPIIAISFVLVCPAIAQQRAEDLVRRCEAKRTSPPSVQTSGQMAEWLGKMRDVDFALGACAGYFAGVLEMNSIYKALKGQPLFCIPPDGISGDQAIKIFLKYASDHPEKLHENTQLFVFGAFVRAFPCNAQR